MNETDSNVVCLKFTFESKDIRTFVDEHGHRWYALKDTFKALGYANPNVSMSRVEIDNDGVCTLDTEVICNSQTTSSNYTRPTKFINEPNLYEVIFSSRMPAAKRFKKWLKETVIPELRATGKYERPEGKKFDNVIDFVNDAPKAVPPTPPKVEVQPDNSIKRLTEALQEALSAINNVTKANNFLLRRMVDVDKETEPPAKPKANVKDNPWKKDTLNVSEIGKLLNRTGSEVNNLLEHLKYIDRRGGRLVITLFGQAHGNYYPFQTKQGDYGRYIRWKPTIVTILQEYLDKQKALN